MKAYLKGLALPLLIAAYPILFLYGHNVWSLSLNSLKLPLAGTLLVAGAVYALFAVWLRKPIAASLAAGLFMVIYYLYGTIYRALIQQDWVAVEHYTLLPLVIALAGYAGYAITRVRKPVYRTVQRILLLLATLLVVFNLFTILPVEVKKAQTKATPVPVTAPPAAADAVAAAATQKKPPDIYYIILDEYVRFDAMRAYWHNNDVDQFDAFLKQNHFFVAPASLSPTINTGTEMASRLNLHQYPETTPDSQILAALKDNKVMQVLKAHGYTNVVINMAYQGVTADQTVNFDASEVGGMAADEFKSEFISDTMFDAFSGLIQDNDTATVRQKEMILYALDKTTNLPNVTSPKFVYTHLLLPHPPFIFDENGNLLPPQDAEDWHYYLGQYKYATKLAQQLVSKILAQSDPNNPPVIILQSDEGARNLQRRTADNIVMNGYLENYPGQYNQYILNALYLPGYDTSTLAPDLPPIDTFKIVLNHYLGTQLTVDGEK